MSDSHSALLSLLDVFENDLHDVSFPDLSAATLRAAADAVDAELAQVAAAEAALAAARQSLETARKDFERTGRRGLAYARIYAESDPTLAARLDRVVAALAAPRAEAPAADAPKKRGRPRKEDRSLFEPKAEDSVPPPAALEAEPDSEPDSGETDLDQVA